MRRTLVVGWGDRGRRTAECWREFNRLYFDNRLLPLPVFFTPATPYGRMVGWTCCGQAVTHIALCAPREGRFLVACRGCLLHEMIHQHLHEQGLDPKHNGEPWRLEIMRLHKEITGKSIWAGAYTVAKVKGADGARASVRTNMAEPGTGRVSLCQKDIARWPMSVGVRLGGL
jgi:hypothetical protein